MFVMWAYYVPAVQTCPMMTSATSDAGVLPRVKTSRMTMAPSSCALSELRHPFKFPIGVLPAATITTSELLYPELAAIVKCAQRLPPGNEVGALRVLVHDGSFKVENSTVSIYLWAQVSFIENMASQVDVSSIVGIQIFRFLFHLTSFLATGLFF